MMEFGFIDRLGNEIEWLEDEGSHIAVAQRIVDKSFSKEFKDSSYSDAVSFLVIEKGYMKVGNWARKTISYRVKRLSSIQKEKILEYVEYGGYELDPDFS